MKANILFAGAPDQDPLYLSQIFQDAAIEAGFRAACLISRLQDDLAQCLVGISDEETMPSPHEPPQVALLANQAAVDHLAYTVKADGLLILNARALQRPIRRHDLDMILVPTEDAEQPIIESMILLGVLIASTGWIPFWQMRLLVQQSSKDKRLSRALERGMQYLHTFANAA